MECPRLNKTAWGTIVRITTVVLLAAFTGLLTACTPAPGSAEWCKGLIEGTVKATPEEMLKNMDTCAKQELAG